MGGALDYYNIQGSGYGVNTSEATFFPAARAKSSMTFDRDNNL